MNGIGRDSLLDTQLLLSNIHKAVLVLMNSCPCMPLTYWVGKQFSLCATHRTSQAILVLVVKCLWSVFHNRLINSQRGFFIMKLFTVSPVRKSRHLGPILNNLLPIINTDLSPVVFRMIFKSIKGQSPWEVGLTTNNLTLIVPPSQNKQAYFHPLVNCPRVGRS